jgi:hypothetical protein
MVTFCPPYLISFFYLSHKDEISGMFIYLTFLILFDFCFENFDGLVNVLLYRDLSLHSD